MTSNEHAPFETWAIVEMLGHKKLAGYVSEQTIAGAALIRVDVPETPAHQRYSQQHPGSQAYTKLIGVASVYAITPCSEDVARAAAQEIERYNEPIPVQLPKLLPSPVASNGSDDWNVEADDDRPF